MTTDTVAKEVARRAGPASSSAAWPRARRCWRRTWRRCWPCSPPTPPPTRPTLQRAARSRRRRPASTVIVTDGCTSTNDTVILLASGPGRAGRRRTTWRDAVAEACFSLAAQMVGDAEGATKVVRVEVAGAASDDEAAAGRAPGRRRASWCKCSWYGEDPYWGRIGSELGSAGIAFDPTRLSVAYGGIDGGRRGRRPSTTTRAAVAAHMAGRHLAHRRRPRPRRRRRPSCSPTTSPTATSTRTWARRDGLDGATPRAAPRRPRCSSRRCRTSAASPARTVVVKYGGNAMADADGACAPCSPRTSC